MVDEAEPPGGGLGRFTYGELAAKARSLAIALDDLGVGAGERVAIMSPNAARFLVALYRRTRVRPGARADQLPTEP